ncbi:methylmalonyl-CoA mutase family protein [Streptomyces sp. NPDC087897]|uniref:methylmalonyl-CoA mutase family protein n=1 Tax=Streptomyces sp. NPDC087897 TaxID=3365817 RepID=UPI0038262641
MLRSRGRAESDRRVPPLHGRDGPGGRNTVGGRDTAECRYAGSATAAASNERYRYLIGQGVRRLSVAFDLPTRRGHDSDTPRARGEVGKAGVAIDSLDDMRVVFSGVPLDGVSTSLMIDAPAALLVLLYQLVAEEQGVAVSRLTGAVRNDVLAEYVARETCIFPPGPSLRLTADVFTYCRAEMPGWNPIVVSGHSMAAAGALPAQEVAFTLANGVAYVRSATAAGLDAADFASRLSFSFAARATAPDETAVLSAARRVWARVVREEFGAGSARPPARTRAPAMYPAAAVAPLVGSEATGEAADDFEVAVLELLRKVEDLGGAVGAVERGFQKDDIERGSGRAAHRPDSGSRNRADLAVEARQTERIAKLRAWREQTRVCHALDLLKKTAESDANVLPPMKDALAAHATVGEVCDALREVWGTYPPSDAE